MYGLLEKDIEFIKQTFAENEVKKAIIFGSRAMGNYKKGSDIDIAIIGASKILTLNDILNEESPMPYFFDLIDYENISNENLIEHINAKGKVIYEVL